MDKRVLQGSDFFSNDVKVLELCGAIVSAALGHPPFMANTNYTSFFGEFSAQAAVYAGLKNNVGIEDTSVAHVFFEALAQRDAYKKEGALKKLFRNSQQRRMSKKAEKVLAFVGPAFQAIRRKADWKTFQSDIAEFRDRTR